MKVNHTTYDSHILKRAIRKITYRYPTHTFGFKTDVNIFPIKYKFTIAGELTGFSISHVEIVELRDTAKLTDKPYEFVIESIYRSCLREINLFNNYITWA